jgi:hypothetical protein
VGLITCYIGEFRKGGDSPAITDFVLHPPSPRAAQTLGSVFLQASGAAGLNFALDWSRRSSVAQIPHMESFSVDLLSSGLEKLLAGPIQHPAVGLLLADFFDPDPGQYGIMFDLDTEDNVVGPRQGCAIFVAGIQQALSNGGNAALLEFVACTAVHELGHALNLWHVENSFMAAHPSADGPHAYEFTPEQQQYLARAANPADARFVLPGPGCSDYGQRPDGVSAPDDTSPFLGPGPGAPARALVLQIALSHQAFHSFEPVELDVTLSLAEGEPESVSVPNAIDPGYESFQIWITDPSGERRRLKSLTRFCRSNGELTIAAGQPYRRDVPIFRQRGGSTFPQAGKHQVQVVFRMAPGRVLLSNSVECEVLPAEPASEGWRAGREILGSQEGRRLLRFKSMPPTPYGYERLIQYAQTHASDVTAAAIEYALGKSILNTVSHTPGRVKSTRGLSKRAKQHLTAAAASGRLGLHRSQVVDTLLAGKARS